MATLGRRTKRSNHCPSPSLGSWGKVYVEGQMYTKVSHFDQGTVLPVIIPFLSWLQYLQQGGLSVMCEICSEEIGSPLSGTRFQSLPPPSVRGSLKSTRTMTTSTIHWNDFLNTREVSDCDIQSPNTFVEGSQCWEGFPRHLSLGKDRGAINIRALCVTSCLIQDMGTGEQTHMTFLHKAREHTILLLKPWRPWMIPVPLGTHMWPGNGSRCIFKSLVPGKQGENGFL